MLFGVFEEKPIQHFFFFKKHASHLLSHQCELCGLACQISCTTIIKHIPNVQSCIVYIHSGLFTGLP